MRREVGCITCAVLIQFRGMESELHFGFAEQTDAVSGGWLQGRYHSEDGDTVADMLSFKSVFEINPFEVGVGHADERRGYMARKRVVERLLDVRTLMRRPFTSLSNGEMRRVLFARALLKGPKRLVLDDPLGGLDPSRRKKMREIVAALGKRGVEIVTASGEGVEQVPGSDGIPAARKGRARRLPNALPVLEMRNVSVSFGKRVLFKDFSWTVREGERWLLRGPNGSGKTTLLALISGDMPRSYAYDISVFGRRRGAEGVTLNGVRSRIGMVSAERQIYLGETSGEQFAAATAKKPRLLLLDEPCYNLSNAASKSMLREIGAWLDRNPRAAAICVAHRPEHVPPGFSLELALPV